MHEVEMSVSKLKTKKSVGVDLVPNEVLKDPGIQTLLYHLFNTCFSTGLVPSQWLDAIIKPIPKGSDKDPYVPLNYRGISLISCVSKLYSSIMNNRIVNYCNLLNIFPEEQNGFRKHRSCEDHIFSLSSIIQNRLNDKLPTFCTFIDLEKAFDWVNRDLLLYKLLCHNIDGKMYTTLKTMLGTTRSCVELNGILRTDWFNIHSGVRQGDTISPTLFGLFINDLVVHLKEKCPTLKIGETELNMLLYADDMVIMAETEDNLQLLLDQVYSWCKMWRLKVNVSKTKVMHFRNIRKKCTEQLFTYGEMELEKVSQYKYLGVMLDEHLKFNACVKMFAESSGRALGGIISKFRNLKNVGYHTFSKMYDAGVKPICEYAAAVWGFHTATDIENIQNRAMRYFLGVHKFAPNAAIIAEMGWTKPIYDRYICIIRYWNRLIQMSEDRLTKKIFMSDFSKCKNNWSSRNKNIFNKIDKQEYFNNLIECNLAHAKNKMVALMEQEWLKDVNKKPKLRSYVLFKTDANVESYVNKAFDRQKRSYVAQLRCGILPLKIETGRFKRLPIEQRICDMCNLNEIEDEKHFICICPSYEIYRIQMYNNIQANCTTFSELTTDEKFVYILKNKWRELSLYIINAWNIRKSHLYSTV